MTLGAIYLFDATNNSELHYQNDDIEISPDVDFDINDSHLVW